MDTLGYQHPRDARREIAADWRRRIFGVSYREAWDALAREINARHESGGWWKSNRVVADIGPWQLVLDLFRTDKIVFTRLRAPFVNPGGLRFCVYRKSVFSELGKRLGMQDIVIGDAAFDETFIVKSNDEHLVRRLLADPQLRALIAAQPRIRFEVKDDEGWFGKTFPPQTDQLQFMVTGVIKDIDLLRGLFNLFAHTLDRLCDLRQATQQPPGVQL